ncbi:hypothetical protein EDD21DRAFT_188595 [Dissophora ornata]|nr:hypothetical protein BGZ58_009674 [Dissophora ornata]KAI8598421.1 hypothetical protein EDD21DRAFT_188595 [Dissophora ornata]
MAAVESIKVIIVGAGIGGLTLAILLERANIAYEILEKHPCNNPLGSAICLVPSVQPLFQQLGLLDEIKRLSKPFGAMVFREENMDIIGTYSSRKPLDIKERYGEYCQIISRRDLCSLLVDQIPRHKIQFGKRVLEIRQNSGEVIVQCADKSVHHADILIGADGVYSAVRQCLHNDLEAKGLLPKYDTTPMGYQYDCLVGVTNPMDPHKNSTLFDKFSEFQTILSKDSTYSYWCIPLTGNRISWMVVNYHDRGKKYAEDTIFKQSDWGVDAAELMSYEYRELKTTYGCALGDLMDKTPKGAMAKVMLEEKFCKTWYAGRVALMGDACHKVVPFGGQGANLAIHDALSFANLLVGLRTNTVPDIEKVFEAYYKERSPIGRSIVQMSSRIGNLMNRKGWINNIVRKAALRHTPRWLAQLANDRMSYDRPQAEYLPFVKVGGALQPRPQKRSAYIPFASRGLQAEKANSTYL